MNTTTLDPWRHPHDFGTHLPTRGERRTRWVIALTFAMMVIEISGGHLLGSMALLADGWHMASHVAALSVTAFAYVYTRRHAGSTRYSFGTGKVGALGGFGSAVALALVAVLVLVESAERLASPVPIRFDEAIAVAGVGLLVNVVSALLLREDHGDPLHHDHNLRAAYLHVLADALTSVLAVVALVAGKLLHWTWMDPAMGAVGALLITRWSWSLLRDTSRVLLDAEIEDDERQAILAMIESQDDNRVADLHLWRVGPRHLAAIVSVVTPHPKQPAHYKELLRERHDLAHVTVEVNQCSAERGSGAS